MKEIENMRPDEAQELATYRLAIPAIVEDFSQMQIQLRDEKTVCEFWKRACERALDLADGYATGANKLREMLIQACKLGLAHLDENSSTQTERMAAADLNRMLTAAEAT